RSGARCRQAGPGDRRCPRQTLDQAPGRARGAPPRPPPRAGAGEGNRTLVTWLGTRNSAIELHPHGSSKKTWPAPAWRVVNATAGRYLRRAIVAKAYAGAGHG